MRVSRGADVKCRDYPKPDTAMKYREVTKKTADVHLGESFFFRCDRGYWRENDNHTEPFGGSTFLTLF